jgi:hypothetical protein
MSISDNIDELLNEILRAKSTLENINDIYLKGKQAKLFFDKDFNIIFEFECDDLDIDPMSKVPYTINLIRDADVVIQVLPSCGYKKLLKCRYADYDVNKYEQIKSEDENLNTLFASGDPEQIVKTLESILETMMPKPGDDKPKGRSQWGKGPRPTMMYKGVNFD